MKKTILLVVLIFSLILTSCATANRVKRTDFHAKEADYALHLALETALNQSFTKLDAKLEKLNFIPTAFKTIDSQKDNITGLPTLVSEFNAYTAFFLKKVNFQIKEYALSLAQNIKFENPIHMVDNANTSTSELFLNIHKQNIKERYLNLLKDYDFSAFDSCIAQYNAYVTTKDIYQKILTSTDITKDIAQIAMTQFEELLKQSEELYRTTPDPYADKIAADVFGIN